MNSPKLHKKARSRTQKTSIQGLPMEKRTEVLGTKVESRVRELVESEAERENQTVSDWIRDVIIKKLSRGTKR